MTVLHTIGRLAALITLALVPSAAMAGDVTVGDLVIHQPWSRATPGGAQVGGGYLTIENRGTVADRLTGGSFAASSGFELHAMSMDGGVMKMRPAGPLEISPGRTVTLDPSGLHIMFTGLKRGLKKGETVPGTLVFEHAGTVNVEFEVESIGAKGPGAAAAPAHAGPAMPGMDMD
jgi:periplasmic copper chaperone A